MQMKRALSKALKSQGILLQGYNYITDDFLRLVRLLNTHKISSVIDVGGSDGTYAVALFDAGYNGRVYSFEPLTDMREKLLERTKKYGNRWNVGPAVALSDSEGSVDFHRTENSNSSSMLPILQAHVDAAPDTSEVEVLKVDTIRLDSFRDLPAASGHYLKLDTQGAETQVLDGCTGLLDQILGIQIELSLVMLYEGQSLWLEVHERLSQMGYELWDMLPGFRRNDGRLYQMDGVYFRRELGINAVRDAA